MNSKTIASRNSIENIIDKVLYVLHLIMATTINFIFVYRQGAFSDRYISDIVPYIEEVLGTNTKFDYPYPILFKTTALLNSIINNPYIAMAVVVTSFNTLAIIITKRELERYTKTKIASTVATAILFSVSMIIIPKLLNHGLSSIYAGVFSPNPWQNQTYMAARPFMILAFIYGVYTTEHYIYDLTNNLWKKEYIIFAVSLLLVTMTKPAYTLPHMCTVFVIAIFKLIKSKGKTFIPSCKLLIYYIPTICVLLYQYKGVFSGVSYTGEENGIGVAFARTWSIWVSNIPLAIILAGAFPITVLIFHIKELKVDFEYLFSWLIYVIGLLMALFLYEKGFREQDFNFAWGYICGLFFVFMTSLAIYIKDCKEAMQYKKNIVILVETIIIMAHLCCGIMYFVYIFRGGFYY